MWTILKHSQDLTGLIRNFSKRDGVGKGWISVRISVRIYSLFTWMHFWLCIKWCILSCTRMYNRNCIHLYGAYSQISILHVFLERLMYLFSCIQVCFGSIDLNRGATNMPKKCFWQILEAFSIQFKLLAMAVQESVLKTYSKKYSRYVKNAYQRCNSLHEKCGCKEV